jgi:hypothetical protein
VSSPENSTSLKPSELLAVGAGAALVTLFFMAPLLSQLGYGMPVHRSDPQFNAWLLTWGADRLPHGLQGFWNPPVFYPYQNSLAYSENLLGIAIFVKSELNLLELDAYQHEPGRPWGAEGGTGGSRAALSGGTDPRRCDDRPYRGTS